jgi:hypothetical protein
MGTVASIVAGVMLCFLNVLLFSLIYRRIPNWYDGTTKLIQFIEATLLLGLIIYVFYLFNYKLNLTLSIICVLLAGDLLEIYYGVLKNLFNRQGRKELFKIYKS